MKMSRAVIVLLLATSPNLGAQVTPEGPRAGAWGAEVGFDASSPDLAAAVLRFRNDRSAWLLGFGTRVEYRDPPAAPRTMTSMNARLGLRSFRSPGSAVRPTVGAGLVGSVVRASGGVPYAWSAGVYGELGVSRFFGENFAVGMSSDVHLRHSDQQGQSDSVLRFTFDVVRLVATVVF
jgi:hypothetical protein